MLETLLVKTDTLIERLFRHPEDSEPVSFRKCMTSPERILVVSDETIEGLNLAQKYLPGLLESFPGAGITLVTGPGQACLLEGRERLQPIDWPQRSAHHFDSRFRGLVAELREGDFDCAFNFACRGNRAEAMLTYHSNARIRVGLPHNDNEKYYNLFVKNIPATVSFADKFDYIFSTLNLAGNTGINLLFEPSAEEQRHADRFIRQRKSSVGGGNFVGYIPAWSQGNRGMERLLHMLATRLVAVYDPLRLIVGDNLAPRDELRKWAEAVPYVHAFDNLRQMFAVLSRCDRIVTSSAGTAAILGRLQCKVALAGAKAEELAMLDSEDLDRITVIPEEDGQPSLDRIVDFTR